MKFSTLFILITICFGSSGCFTRWVMSEKEIREHYANKEIKPVFFTIENDSVELFLATTGMDTMPPLLLIHGAPGGWFSNIGFLDDPELQKHYHIIAVDRPGYRKSKFRKKKKSVTSIEIQSVAIHEALKVNRSRQKGVVYGNSYGAPIALRMSVNYPEEFYHAVLTSGAFDPDNEKFWWFHKYTHGLFYQVLMPRFIKTATDEKFAHAEELRKLLPDWQRLTIPVTVIQGTADNIVPYANFDFARRQLGEKPAEFISVEGAGHLLRRSHPDLIRSILLNLARKPEGVKP